MHGHTPIIYISSIVLNKSFQVLENVIIIKFIYKVHIYLVEPSEVITSRTLIQVLRRNIPRLDMDALSPISTFVIKHHPKAKSQSQENTSATKGSGGDKCREILGCILATEDVGAYDSHEVGDRDSDASKHHTSSLVGNVVIVP